MANAIYYREGTTLTFNDTGTTTTFGLNNLAAGAGRQGDLFDFGDLGTARPARYKWRLKVEFATAPVVGETIGIYIKTSDGTSPDNDDGTTDAAVSAVDKLKNLRRIGTLIVDEAAASTVEHVAHGEFRETARWIGPVIWNFTADNLVATNDLSHFLLTPFYLEVQ